MKTKARKQLWSQHLERLNCFKCHLKKRSLQLIQCVVQCPFTWSSQNWLLNHSSMPQAMLCGSSFDSLVCVCSLLTCVSWWPAHSCKPIDYRHLSQLVLAWSTLSCWLTSAFTATPKLWLYIDGRDLCLAGRRRIDNQLITGMQFNHPARLIWHRKIAAGRIDLIFMYR